MLYTHVSWCVQYVMVIVYTEYVGLMHNVGCRLTHSKSNRIVNVASYGHDVDVLKYTMALMAANGNGLLAAKICHIEWRAITHRQQN